MSCLLVYSDVDCFVHAGKLNRIYETELGVVSQCCQPKQALKLSKQCLEHVALKNYVKVSIELMSIVQTI